MSSVHLKKKVLSNSLMVSAESPVLAGERLQGYFHKPTRHNVQSVIVVKLVLGNQTLAYGYQRLKHYFRISL